MSTIYEWDRETVDEYGDVQDHNHAEKLATIWNDSGVLVLVRDQYDQSGSLDRSWAYVKNGSLPEFFTDAYDRPVVRVPKRFHIELKRVKK